MSINPATLNLPDTLPSPRGIIKHIPDEKILYLRCEKKLSHQQIAKLCGCHHSNITQRLHKLNIEGFEYFAKNKSTQLEHLQHRITTSIADDDIKKAPFGSRVMALGILHDKIRLDRGQSTDNISIKGVINSMLGDLEDIRKRKAELLQNGANASIENVDNSINE